MKKKSRRKWETTGLVAGSLLWSLGSVGIWIFWEFLLGNGGLLLGVFMPFLLLAWWCVGPVLFVVGIFRLIQRQRGAVLLLLNVLFPVLVWGIFKDTMPKIRWEHEKAAMLHQLQEAQAQPFDSLPLAPHARKDGAFDVRLVSPNFRLSRDQAGHIRASFVRFRMGLDNGVAYVYDPQDKLTAEIFAKNGKTEYATTGLGWALSGFGVLSGITPLGDHWYRCGFT